MTGIGYGTYITLWRISGKFQADMNLFADWECPASYGATSLFVGVHDMFTGLLQTYPAIVFDASWEKSGIPGESNGQLRPSRQNCTGKRTGT